MDELYISIDDLSLSSWLSVISDWADETTSIICRDVPIIIYAMMITSENTIADATTVAAPMIYALVVNSVFLNMPFGMVNAK